ncbi:AAA family ATPase [Aeromonas veronii]|uniref:AAA family ATPase n=1 Tax=Aeromonas veronii TaxID=654 RepID=UPI003D1A7529
MLLPEQNSLSLHHITLTNYRCFASLSLDFHPQMTVLIAPNGAGKSTILDAVAVAVSPFVAAFDLGKGRPIAKSDARYLRQEQMTSNEQMFPVEIVASFNQPACQIKRALTGINNKTTVKEASELAAYGEGLMAQVRNVQTVDLPVVAYYGTSRLWLEHRNMERKAVVSASRSMGYEDCLTPASNFKQLQQWFTKATLAELQQQQMAEVYQGYTLKAQITGIQAAIDAILQPASGWHHFHYSFPHEELAMTHPEQGVLPVSLLSDGVRAMVSLVADLAWRCIKLNPHLGKQAALQTHGIVMIDEVDMFLHPAWQQQVLGALQQAFPLVQFIVTTHSPQVLTTVAKENIRQLGSDEHGAYARMPPFSPLAHDNSDALAKVMDTHSQPSLPLQEAISEYELLVRTGQETSKRATALLATLEQAGYQFHESDLATWRFLAQRKLAAKGS